MFIKCVLCAKHCVTDFRYVSVHEHVIAFEPQSV